MLECEVQAEEDGARLWIVAVIDSTAYFWVVTAVVGDGEEVAHLYVCTEFAETYLLDEFLIEVISQLHVLQAEV